MNRDPRTDPRPGDVLRSAMQRERAVSATLLAPWDGACGLVRYTTKYGHWGTITLRCWQRWASDAEVLHVAPDEETQT